MQHNSFTMTYDMGTFLRCRHHQNTLLETQEKKAPEINRAPV